MAGAPKPQPSSVLGVGELLWDLLPDGPQLGGAPTNFAVHARALGAQAALISRVGDDELGREALARIAAVEVTGDLLTVDQKAPTGTVSVTLEGAGQPCYTIHEDVAWDRIHAGPAALAAAGAAEAICFGSLAQRARESREAIEALVAATPEEALRIFDINLRQRFYTPEVLLRSLELANVLKINDAEWPVLAELFGLAGSLRLQIETIADRYSLRVVAFTRGAHGSLLYRRDEWSDEPGRPVEVADTIGAGDSFTAAMALALLRGWELPQVHRFAAEVARFVCSQPGATPRLPERFARALDAPPPE